MYHICAPPTQTSQDYSNLNTSNFFRTVQSIYCLIRRRYMVSEKLFFGLQWKNGLVILLVAR